MCVCEMKLKKIPDSLLLIMQADPPNAARIPREDVVGVTVVLLTCSYRQQEFIRVGYYVNNEYMDPEIRENPPQEPDFDKVLSVACSFSSDVVIPIKYELLFDTVPNFASMNEDCHRLFCVNPTETVGATTLSTSYVH